MSAVKKWTLRIKNKLKNYANWWTKSSMKRWRCLNPWKLAETSEILPFSFPWLTFFLFCWNSPELLWLRVCSWTRLAETSQFSRGNRIVRNQNVSKNAKILNNKTNWVQSDNASRQTCRHVFILIFFKNQNASKLMKSSIFRTFLTSLLFSFRFSMF